MSQAATSVRYSHSGRLLAPSPRKSAKSTRPDFVGMYDFNGTLGEGHFSVVKRATVLPLPSLPPHLLSHCPHCPPSPSSDYRAPINLSSRP
jgi:hypothetical protein